MSKLLSPAQMAAYERDGFVCPVPVLSTAEAQAARAEAGSSVVCVRNLVPAPFLAPRWAAAH